MKPSVRLASLVVAMFAVMSGCRADTDAVWCVDERDMAASAAVERTLLSRAVDRGFRDVAFGEVVAFFRDTHKLNIHVKWGTLRAANIDERTSVNVVLRNVTVAEALRTVLDEAGGVNPLDYVVRNGIITVSTRDDFRRLTVTCVYGIRELTAAAPGTERAEAATILMRIVRASVHPESWRGADPPGFIGSIRVFAGKLVITHSPQSHRRIRRLLEALRGRGPKAVSPVAWPIGAEGPPPSGPGAVWGVEEQRLAASVAVERTLLTRTVDMDLVNTTFGEALTFLRQAGKLKIRANWEALRKVNIDDRMPVNVSLGNVALARALRTVLADVNGLSQPDYVVEGGAVTVSTKTDLSSRLVVRVYDVQDLVSTGPAGARQQTVDALLDTIRVSIDLESWRGADDPGYIGVASEFAGKLVVKQTLLNHRRVWRLLEALRGRGAVSRPRAGPGAVWRVDEQDVAASAALERSLRTRVIDARFGKATFGEVIAFFRDACKLNVHAKWEALRAADIDGKTPVSVELTNVRLGQVLRTVLEDVGGVNPLDYVVEGGVLTVSTWDDLSRAPLTRVYDAGDLISRAKGAGSAEVLAGVIRAGIYPESWRGADPPGFIGSIRVFGDKLVVTHLARTHRRIRGLLEALRGRAPRLPPLPGRPQRPLPPQKPARRPDSDLAKNGSAGPPQGERNGRQ